jgi:hypothetical protein
MSEHKTNEVALFQASLPSLTTTGDAVAIDFQAVVMPKKNVLLIPAKDIGDEGRKIRLPGKQEYEDAPEGARVFELGKQLPPDACDVVIVLGTRVARAGSLTSLDGQRSRPIVSQVGHVPISRIPLDQWRREHASQLDPQN